MVALGVTDVLVERVRLALTFVKVDKRHPKIDSSGPGFQVLLAQMAAANTAHVSMPVKRAVPKSAAAKALAKQRDVLITQAVAAGKEAADAARIAYVAAVAAKTSSDLAEQAAIMETERVSMLRYFGDETADPAVVGILKAGSRITGFGYLPPGSWSAAQDIFLAVTAALDGLLSTTWARTPEVDAAEISLKLVQRSIARHCMKAPWTEQFWAHQRAMHAQFLLDSRASHLFVARTAVRVVAAPKMTRHTSLKRKQRSSMEYITSKGSKLVAASSELQDVLLQEVLSKYAPVKVRAAEVSRASKGRISCRTSSQLLSSAERYTASSEGAPLGLLAAPRPKKKMSGEQVATGRALTRRATELSGLSCEESRSRCWNRISSRLVNTVDPSSALSVAAQRLGEEAGT
ncbi:hypothetical protein B484DRAFT_15720, partial [Ochromonadaceae sp. CCMP2298]